MVTLPLGPHEFDSAACSDLGCVVRWHIVLAVDANVASNGIGLHLGSARGHMPLIHQPLLTVNRPSVTGPLSLNLRVILFTPDFWGSL